MVLPSFAFPQPNIKFIENGRRKLFHIFLFFLFLHFVDCDCEWQRPPYCVWFIFFIQINRHIFPFYNFIFSIFPVQRMHHTHARIPFGITPAAFLHYRRRTQTESSNCTLSHMSHISYGSFFFFFHHLFDNIFVLFFFPAHDPCCTYSVMKTDFKKKKYVQCAASTSCPFL